MAENKVQDYTEDKNEGHVDTREANFECEKKDENVKVEEVLQEYKDRIKDNKFIFLLTRELKG